MIISLYSDLFRKVFLYSRGRYYWRVGIVARRRGRWFKIVEREKYYLFMRAIIIFSKKGEKKKTGAENISIMIYGNIFIIDTNNDTRGVNHSKKRCDFFVIF